MNNSKDRRAKFVLWLDRWSASGDEPHYVKGLDAIRKREEHLIERARKASSGGTAVKLLKYPKLSNGYDYFCRFRWEFAYGECTLRKHPQGMQDLAFNATREELTTIADSEVAHEAFWAMNNEMLVEQTLRENKAANE